MDSIVRLWCRDEDGVVITVVVLAVVVVEVVIVVENIESSPNCIMEDTTDLVEDEERNNDPQADNTTAVTADTPFTDRLFRRRSCLLPTPPLAKGSDREDLDPDPAPSA